MTAKKVYVTDYDFGELSLEKELLAPLGADVIGLNVKQGDSLFAAAPDADILITQFAEIRRATIKQYAAGGRLRGICRYGIGVDVIDLAAAHEHGIAVTNVPGYCVDEVADHTIALGLMLIRRIPMYDRATHRGQWHWDAAGGPVRACRGLRWGFIGLGRIGRNAAAKLAAFGFIRQAYDPYVPAADMANLGVTPVGLDELFRTSDVISVTCNYSQATHHIIDEAALAVMKPTTIVINCARGKCVDNKALGRALAAGRLAAAGLDDIEEEPAKLADWNVANHPLFQLDKLIITPHVGYFSEKSCIAMRLGAIENAKAMLLGDIPPNLVVPDR